MQVMMGTSLLKREEPTLRQSVSQSQDSGRESGDAVNIPFIASPRVGEASAPRGRETAAFLANPKDRRYLCPSREGVSWYA